ncbi:MAG: aminopeptidase P N-terminal domain-containing protein, partial [Planctomycetota bacterium]|nr:aminopeptidase P N-terminal domain-containing protein [Planctomycetota bacterium]
MTNCPTELTRKRRKAVLKILEDRMAVVFAGEGGAAVHGGPWRPNPHFEYLTGIRDEPGAILLLDPSHPQKTRRCMLFL